MITTSTAVVFLGVVFSCTAYTSAFFLNWGSAEQLPPQKQQQLQQQQGQWPVTAYYQQRVLQQPQYTMTSENGAPVQIPAIPIQVPLQAQLSPAASIQNVQLVPCLCPVAQDYEYDKLQETPQGVFVSQLKQQQPTH